MTRRQRVREAMATMEKLAAMYAAHGQPCPLVLGDDGQIYVQQWAGQPLPMPGAEMEARLALIRPHTTH